MLTSRFDRARALISHPCGGQGAKPAALFATVLAVATLAVACATGPDKAQPPQTQQPEIKPPETQQPETQEPVGARPAGLGLAHVTGTADFGEPIELSPEAVVDIRLIDVSVADAPAETIAQQLFAEPGQVPISFKMAYQSARIDPHHRYAVRVEIRENGRLILTTDVHHPVLTNGAGDRFEILLRRVAMPKVGMELLDTNWELVELRGSVIRSSGGQQAIHVVLKSADAAVQGFAGCNRFFGSYEADLDRLSFGPLGSTRMFCADTQEIETAFLQSLSAVERYEIRGDELLAYDSGGSALRFKAAEVPPARLQ